MVKIERQGAPTLNKQGEIKNKRYPIGILNANVLKIIALVAMTIDHIGAIIFPGEETLRIIGRLAFPIFAYMIAEGCFYSKHKSRYITEVLVIGLLCQIVYYITSKDMHLNILLTFSVSISIIFLIQKAQKTKNPALWVAVGVIIAAVFILHMIIPIYYRHFPVDFDYGFFGIMLPVGVYLMPGRILKLAMMAAGLIALGIVFPGVQMWGLLALIPLALYSGKKGKLPMKHFFYIYYPVHMAVLWTIAGMIK